MGKILRNRTLNKYLTLFNEERIILLYTFAKVIKMKCIILILNGYRYYGVILVFITIWYSYYFISLLRKRYWDVRARIPADHLLLHQSTAKAVLRRGLTYSASINQRLHQSTAKAVIWKFKVLYVQRGVWRF